MSQYRVLKKRVEDLEQMPTAERPLRIEGGLPPRLNPAPPNKEAQMGVSEVKSPINSSSKFNRFGTGSNPPIGPGSRSGPSRGRADQAAQQEPPRAHVSLGEEGSKVTVTGPQSEHGARPQERQSPEE